MSSACSATRVLMEPLWNPICSSFDIFSGVCFFAGMFVPGERGI